MAVDEEVSELLRKEGVNAVADLRASLLSTGRQATGKTAASLTYAVENQGRKVFLYVLGDASWRFVERGRGPGGVPPYKPIEEWVLARGLAEPGVPIQRTVNAIRFAIAKSGTRKPVRPFAAPTVPGVRDRIVRELRPVVARAVLKSLTVQLKTR